MPSFEEKMSKGSSTGCNLWITKNDRLSRAGSNPKAYGITIIHSFLLFKGIHEHYVVPNQVGNDDPSSIIIS